MLSESDKDDDKKTTMRLKRDYTNDNDDADDDADNDFVHHDIIDPDKRNVAGGNCNITDGRHCTRDERIRSDGNSAGNRYLLTL